MESRNIKLENNNKLHDHINLILYALIVTNDSN